METKEIVNARQTRMGPKEARALLKGQSELIVAKGKKVERIDLKKGLPDQAMVTRLMVGPSGNLRAPTLKVGKRILVGFNEDAYGDVLG